MIRLGFDPVTHLAPDGTRWEDFNTGGPKSEAAEGVEKLTPDTPDDAITAILLGTSGTETTSQANTVEASGEESLGIANSSKSTTSTHTNDAHATDAATATPGAEGTSDSDASINREVVAATASVDSLNVASDGDPDATATPLETISGSYTAPTADETVATDTEHSVADIRIDVASQTDGENSIADIQQEVASHVDTSDTVADIRGLADDFDAESTADLDDDAAAASSLA